tara:strand:+ start:71 stop:595 length:525 start_codon:yes stop_codon:yes gene_type:complete
VALFKLFFVFLRAGLCAIGGAYSFLPILEKELVENYSWLSKEEFLDILGIAKIFPGAISIKYATYVGHKVGGVWGAIVANLGNLCAPAILIFAATSLYTKYKDLPSVKGAFSTVQLVVFSMIIAVAFQLINISQLIHIRSLLIIVISFVLFVYTKVHPALIIIGAAVVGVFISR